MKFSRAAGEKCQTGSSGRFMNYDSISVTQRYLVLFLSPRFPVWKNAHSGVLAFHLHGKFQDGIFCQLALLQSNPSFAAHPLLRLLCMPGALGCYEKKRR